jgi:hypothetical protein
MAAEGEQAGDREQAIEAAEGGTAEEGTAEERATREGATGEGEVTPEVTVAGLGPALAGERRWP